MSSGMQCLANLFDIILADPIRYHVAQSAINLSLQPSLSAGFNESNITSTFKDIVQEAKHAQRNHPPILASPAIPTSSQSSSSSSPASPSAASAPSLWRWYKFDPEEPDPAQYTPCRYDDPYLYEDAIDDTQVDQEAGQFRVVAAKGLSMMQVGSFTLRASYPSMLLLSVNERVDRLHLHFFPFVPSPFDPNAGGVLANLKSPHGNDPIMHRLYKFTQSNSSKERHIAVEFINFLNSKEYGITWKIDDISSVYFHRSSKHLGMGLVVFQLKQPTKMFRRRDVHSSVFMKRYYSSIDDWTNNGQASKFSRYYIMGDAQELSSMLNNITLRSREFLRVYNADHTILRTTLDNVFFSGGDDQNSTAAASMSTDTTNSQSPKKALPQRKFSEVVGVADATQYQVSSSRVLLSPRLSTGQDGPIATSSVASSNPPLLTNKPAPITPSSTSPPISPNPWKTVPHARARMRNRDRANSSPCLLTESMRASNSKKFVEKLGASRAASPTPHNSKSTSGNAASPRGSPRSTTKARSPRSSSGSPRHAPKSSPKLTAIDDISLQAESPGYSSESESTSPRIPTLAKLPPVVSNTQPATIQTLPGSPIPSKDSSPRARANSLVTKFRTYSAVVRGSKASISESSQEFSPLASTARSRLANDNTNASSNRDMELTKLDDEIDSASKFSLKERSPSISDSSSDGDMSSDGSGTQSSDADPIMLRVSPPQAQRVPSINFANMASHIASNPGSQSINLDSDRRIPQALWSNLCAPMVVLSPRSSSSSSSPSTSSPTSSPPGMSPMEAILASPRRTLLGHTAPLSPRAPTMSPRGITQSPRNNRASPRNSVIPLIFGSNPLSPRNGVLPIRTPPPRTVRKLDRSSQLAIPESPSGNYRAANYLSEEEKIIRLQLLQVLIQTGILEGDPYEYPIRNLLSSASPTTINHKLGELHKKISPCLLDYLNFSCHNGEELENKIYDKFVHLYINGIDSDSEDEEQHVRRRRLWNVGSSGKDSFRTTVELINWLQYETGNLPVFYSMCKEELVSRDFVWHCRKCRACVDWQYFHCSKCEKCVWGVNPAEPHVCDKAAVSKSMEEDFPEAN